MSCAVKIPGVPAVFFLTDVPDDPDELEIEEGAWVEIVSNYALWSGDAEVPRQFLCQSTADPKHYKMFKNTRDINPEEFAPTNLTFGGTFSKTSWNHYVQKAVPFIKSFHAIPDTDPPGAMEEAMRHIREAR